MCAQGPSALLSKAENVGQIRVIMIAHGCQPISHLIFADDSILFFQATVTKWQHIQTILAIYEEASGQYINKKKTTILFSSKTSENIKHQIQEIARMSICYNPGSYLGLPSIVGKAKCNTFGSLKDKVC